MKDCAWKEVWNLNVPSVVKTFLWKVLNDCLPTRVNLTKRRVMENPKCPICEREEETISHTLWSCPAATDVWAEAGSPVQKWPSTERDMVRIWESMTLNIQQEGLEVVAVIMRGIWHRRNKFIFESSFSSPKTVVKQARDCLDEFLLAHSNAQGEEIKRGTISRVGRWQPLVGNAVKVNWDAAFNSKTNKMEAGIIMRMIKVRS